MHVCINIALRGCILLKLKFECCCGHNWPFSESKLFKKYKYWMKKKIVYC